MNTDSSLTPPSRQGVRPRRSSRLLESNRADSDVAAPKVTGLLVSGKRKSAARSPNAAPTVITDVTEPSSMDEPRTPTRRNPQTPGGTASEKVAKSSKGNVKQPRRSQSGESQHQMPRSEIDLTQDSLDLSNGGPVVLDRAPSSSFVSGSEAVQHSCRDQVQVIESAPLDINAGSADVNGGGKSPAPAPEYHGGDEGDSDVPGRLAKKAKAADSLVEVSVTRAFDASFGATATISKGVPVISANITSGAPQSSPGGQRAEEFSVATSTPHSISATGTVPAGEDLQRMLREQALKSMLMARGGKGQPSAVSDDLTGAGISLSIAAAAPATFTPTSSKNQPPLLPVSAGREAAFQRPIAESLHSPAQSGIHPSTASSTTAALSGPAITIPFTTAGAVKIGNSDSGVFAAASANKQAHPNLCTSVTATAVAAPGSAPNVVQQTPRADTLPVANDRVDDRPDHPKPAASTGALASIGTPVSTSVRGAPPVAGTAQTGTATAVWSGTGQIGDCSDCGPDQMRGSVAEGLVHACTAGRSDEPATSSTTSLQSTQREGQGPPAGPASSLTSPSGVSAQAGPAAASPALRRVDGRTCDASATDSARDTVKPMGPNLFAASICRVPASGAPAGVGSLSKGVSSPAVIGGGADNGAAGSVRMQAPPTLPEAIPPATSQEAAGGKLSHESRAVSNTLREMVVAVASSQVVGSDPLALTAESNVSPATVEAMAVENVGAARAAGTEGTAGPAAGTEEAVAAGTIGSSAEAGTLLNSIDDFLTDQRRFGAKNDRTGFRLVSALPWKIEAHVVKPSAIGATAKQGSVAKRTTTLPAVSGPVAGTAAPGLGGRARLTKKPVAQRGKGPGRTALLGTPAAADPSLIVSFASDSDPEDSDTGSDPSAVGGARSIGAVGTGPAAVPGVPAPSASAAAGRAAATVVPKAGGMDAGSPAPLVPPLSPSGSGKSASALEKRIAQLKRNIQQRRVMSGAGSTAAGAGAASVARIAVAAGAAAAAGRGAAGFGVTVVVASTAAAATTTAAAAGGGGMAGAVGTAPAAGPTESGATGIAGVRGQIAASGGGGSVSVSGSGAARVGLPASLVSAANPQQQRPPAGSAAAAAAPTAVAAAGGLAEKAIRNRSPAVVDGVSRGLTPGAEVRTKSPVREGMPLVGTSGVGRRGAARSSPALESDGNERIVAGHNGAHAEQNGPSAARSGNVADPSAGAAVRRPSPVLHTQVSNGAGGSEAESVRRRSPSGDVVGRGETFVARRGRESGEERSNDSRNTSNSNDSQSRIADVPPPEQLSGGGCESRDPMILDIAANRPAHAGTFLPQRMGNNGGEAGMHSGGGLSVDNAVESSSRPAAAAGAMVAERRGGLDRDVLQSLLSGGGVALSTESLMRARAIVERKLRGVRRLVEENLREDLELQMQIHQLEASIADQQQTVMATQDLLNQELISFAETSDG